MRFFKKFAGLFAAALLLLPSVGQAYTINGNLDVRGNIVGGLRHLGPNNLNLNVSGSTLTIQCGNAACSTSNTGWITVPGTTAGTISTYKITASPSVTFGSTSDTDGNDFGVTASVNWSTMPFFVGFIHNGTTGHFTISRVPLPVSGSAAATLCQKGDLDCDGQDDIMILTTGLTLSAWVDLPHINSAWMVASYATTGSAWTFSLTNQTGFNYEYETKLWAMPLGQNGATAGTFMKANGGGAAIFVDNDFVYAMNRTCFVDLTMAVDGDGGTDGSGAFSATFSAPYSFNGGGAAATLKAMGGAQISAPAYGQVMNARIDANTTNMVIRRNTSATAHSDVLNSDFSNGARTVYLTLRYKACDPVF